MSSNKKYIVLRFEGPLQSWGFDSQYNRRNTGLFPTKSAIAGICCAALGFTHGSQNELEFLNEFNKTRMTAISIPKKNLKGDLLVRRLQDYHTVQNTRRASGSINHDCVLTYRQFLLDAVFGVLLKGENNLMDKISSALCNPKWGIWLGRKTCIPSTPVFVGTKKNRKEALQILLGDEPLESFTYQEDAKNFCDGHDSLPDLALSFTSEKRIFTHRRINIYYGKG